VFFFQLVQYTKKIILCRLKKEMVTRVNQVSAEFRKASNRQIADTTKRTIRENVAISAQLSKISDKTVELITNNDCLKERERRHRQEIELLQVSETLLTEKNIANQKVIFELLFDSDTDDVHCVSKQGTPTLSIVTLRRINGF